MAKQIILNLTNDLYKLQPKELNLVDPFGSTLFGKLTVNYTSGLVPSAESSMLQNQMLPLHTAMQNNWNKRRRFSSPMPRAKRHVPMSITRMPPIQACRPAAYRQPFAITNPNFNPQTFTMVAPRTNPVVPSNPNLPTSDHKKIEPDDDDVMIIENKSGMLNNTQKQTPPSSQIPQQQSVSGNQNYNRVEISPQSRPNDSIGKTTPNRYATEVATQNASRFGTEMPAHNQNRNVEMRGPLNQNRQTSEIVSQNQYGTDFASQNQTRQASEINPQNSNRQTSEFVSQNQNRYVTEFGSQNQTRQASEINSQNLTRQTSELGSENQNRYVSEFASQKQPRQASEINSQNLTRQTSEFVSENQNRYISEFTSQYQPRQASEINSQNSTRQTSEFVAESQARQTHEFALPNRISQTSEIVTENQTHQVSENNAQSPNPQTSDFVSRNQTLITSEVVSQDLVRRDNPTTQNSNESRIPLPVRSSSALETMTQVSCTPVNSQFFGGKQMSAAPSDGHTERVTAVIRPIETQQIVEQVRGCSVEVGPSEKYNKVYPTNCQVNTVTDMAVQGSKNHQFEDIHTQLPLIEKTVERSSNQSIERSAPQSVESFYKPPLETSYNSSVDHQSQQSQLNSQNVTSSVAINTAMPVVTSVSSVAHRSSFPCPMINSESYPTTFNLRSYLNNGMNNSHVSGHGSRIGNANAPNANGVTETTQRNVASSGSEMAMDLSYPDKTTAPPSDSTVRFPMRGSPITQKTINSASNGEPSAKSNSRESG